MYEYKATVKRVLDGDTVELDVDLGFGIWNLGSKYRLAGINAYSTRSKDPEEKMKGVLGKERLLELCPIGSEVTVLIKKAKEKYGRYLTVIQTNVIGADNVNQILLKEGLAVPYYEMFD